jgi:hypothetical protein
VPSTAKLVVDEGDVEVELSGGFGFDLAGSELDDEVAQPPDVEEQSM